jgi:hypothetical protein
MVLLSFNVIAPEVPLDKIDLVSEEEKIKIILMEQKKL